MRLLHYTLAFCTLHFLPLQGKIPPAAKDMFTNMSLEVFLNDYRNSGGAIAGNRYERIITDEIAVIERSQTTIQTIDWLQRVAAHARRIDDKNMAEQATSLANELLKINAAKILRIIWKKPANVAVFAVLKVISQRMWTTIPIDLRKRPKSHLKQLAKFDDISSNINTTWSKFYAVHKGNAGVEALHASNPLNPGRAISEQERTLTELNQKANDLLRHAARMRDAYSVLWGIPTNPGTGNHLVASRLHIAREYLDPLWEKHVDRPTAAYLAGIAKKLNELNNCPTDARMREFGESLVQIYPVAYMDFALAFRDYVDAYEKHILPSIQTMLDWSYPHASWWDFYEYMNLNWKPSTTGKKHE